MKNPLVNILILNWNNKNILAECVDSIMRSNYDNYKITVIDNGSEDDSIDYIQSLYKDVQFIKINNNLGYAGGYNYAFKYLNSSNDDSKWYLLLNNDTKVNVNTIKTLITNSKIYGENHIYSPKIMNNNNKIWYAGGNRNRLTGNMYHVGINRDESIASYKNCCTQFISGCCMLIRKDIINKLNGFNKNYKMYYEDVDLCFRAKKHNISCYFISECSISHHISYSLGGRYSFSKMYNKINSFLKFIYFNDKLYMLFIYLIVNIILLPAYILNILYRKIINYEK